MTHDDFQPIIALIADVEQRIVDRITTATPSQIAALRTGITARITAEMAAAEARGYAKAYAARLHTSEITVTDLHVRIAALEDRMLNLETRRPPH